MPDSTILCKVDVIAGKHLLGPLAELGGLCKLDEQVKGARREDVLAKVKEHLAPLCALKQEVELFKARLVLGKELSQTHGLEIGLDVLLDPLRRLSFHLATTPTMTMTQTAATTTTKQTADSNDEEKKK